MNETDPESVEKLVQLLELNKTQFKKINRYLYFIVFIFLITVSFLSYTMLMLSQDVSTKEIDNLFLRAYIEYLEPDKATEYYPLTLEEMIAHPNFSWDLPANHPMYIEGMTFGDLADTQENDFLKALNEGRWLDNEVEKFMTDPANAHLREKADNLADELLKDINKGLKPHVDQDKFIKEAAGEKNSKTE